MTRIARYRAFHLLVLALLLAAVLAWTGATGSLAGSFLAGAVLLVPGRVQGVLYRELFRGRRMLAKGEPEAALALFERFLQRLHRQPWRRWVLWLSWSVYTPSAEAMGLNNLGAARAAMGQVEAAEQAWSEALSLDPLYAVPHVNLAAAAAGRGESGRARALLAKAASLGYTGGPLDRATHQVQELLARVEARGPAA